MRKNAGQDLDLLAEENASLEKITIIETETAERKEKEKKKGMIAELMTRASIEIDEIESESEVVKESVIQSIQGIEDQDLEVKIIARAMMKKTMARE